MQRPARSSRAEQAERDFNAHMAQVVDKESPGWVLEAKHREVLDPLPAGAVADPMTQTKTGLFPLIIDAAKAKQACKMCKETAVGLPTSHIIQALDHMHVVSYEKIHGPVGLVCASVNAAWAATPLYGDDENLHYTESEDTQQVLNELVFEGIKYYALKYVVHCNALSQTHLTEMEDWDTNNTVMETVTSMPVFVPLLHLLKLHEAIHTELQRITLATQPAGSNAAAVMAENRLGDCMAKAFSGTERNICQKKFGGAKTPFGF